MKPSPKPPYALPAAAVAEELRVDPQCGLDDAEAADRRARFGPNLLQARRPLSNTALLMRQLVNPVVALLTAATVASASFGEWHQAVAVGVVLIINTAIGYLTERKAVRSMEALRALGGRTARVRRAGQSRTVPAGELVPGDVVLLEAGDVVSADLRCLTAAALGIDESALTGESVPVGKDVDPTPQDTDLPERTSMLFKGTHVVRGSGEGIVVATGLDTELGRITELVEAADTGESPLQRQLARLSRQLVWVTLLLAVAVAAAGMLTGQPVGLMIETAIALAVAATPEGLPIVATLTLARGMLRMAQEQALVEKLPAVETLGATTVVITDKTGTLTENRMRVERVVTASGSHPLDYTRADSEVRPELRRALLVGVLCGNAEFDHETGTGTGDPMEVALVHAGWLAGLRREDELSRFPEAAEHPFDPATRWMATVHRDADGYFTALKGAPEAVLPLIGQLRPDERTGWLASAEELAAEGLRVLALASGPCADPTRPLDGELTLLGLAALRDPPRADIRGAVDTLAGAGIEVAMATGDHPATARAIARDVGITEQRVHARVSPEDKLALIEQLQREGEVVAMIGDGVNDAPALVKADIGVAMGQRGTEVARQASDMVLLDDRFSTIVTATREGRVIFDNIRRFSTYLLSCNLAEVLVVTLAIFAGLPLPLLPLQILFLNLVTDVFPAFALASSKAEGDVLRRPPRPPREQIIPPGGWPVMALYAAAIAASTLAAQFAALHWLGFDTAAANTVSFLTIALAQLWHVFNMRSPGSAFLANAVTRNRYLWSALALCIGLLVAALAIPGLAAALQISPISGTGWLLTVVASLIPLAFGQLWLVVRHRAARAAVRSKRGTRRATRFGRHRP